MNQYIVNLTNHLIGKNQYREAFRQIRNTNRFVEHVKITLQSDDVRDMSPAKLGEIMCSFEIGDVMAKRLELFGGTHFSGDCEEFLRELVSLCLAYVIRDRISDEYSANTSHQIARDSTVPSYLESLDSNVAKRRRS